MRFDERVESDGPLILDVKFALPGGGAHVETLYVDPRYLATYAEIIAMAVGRARANGVPVANVLSITSGDESLFNPVDDLRL